MYQENFLQAGTAPAILLGPNLRRVGVIIGTPPTTVIYIRFGAAPDAQHGLPLYPLTAPFKIDEAWMGSAITQEIWVVSPGGVQSVYIQEVFTT